LLSSQPTGRSTISKESEPRSVRACFFMMGEWKHTRRRDLGHVVRSRWRFVGIRKPRPRSFG
jgi:hypothetical protein